MTELGKQWSLTLQNTLIIAKNLVVNLPFEVKVSDVTR